MEAEIKAAFSYLDNHKGELSTYCQTFLNGLRKHLKRHGKLSERQYECLISIRNNTGSN